MTEPRTDCPMHMPAPPPPAVGYSPENEAALPINGLQEYIMTVHAAVLGEDYPSHIKNQVLFFPLQSSAFILHNAHSFLQ
jgi:hypothetical protein